MHIVLDFVICECYNEKVKKLDSLQSFDIICGENRQQSGVRFMIKYKNAIKPIVIFLLSMILICTTLYTKENVVLTNNGDFNRVMGLCSLYSDSDGSMKISLGENDYKTTIKEILTLPEDTTQYPTSQLMFVRFSVALSHTVNVIAGNQQNTYHPVCLSLMYAILYALALTFFLTQIRVKGKFASWLVLLAALIVLCDIGYVSYFNSLYAEGLQHMLLVASLGFFLTLWKRPLGVFGTVFFAIILILYGQSKMFNIPLAILMACLAVVFTLRHSFKSWRFVLTAVASVWVIVVLFGNYMAIPKWINTETTYNSVFFGVVKDCDEALAKEYLLDLQIDPQLSDLRDTHRYVSNIHPIRDTYSVEHAEAVSKFKILGFYAKHPMLTLHKFKEIAEHCSHLRNIFFMDENFMEDSFRCSVWSKLREHLAFDTLLWNLLIVLLFFGLLWYRFRQSDMNIFLSLLSVFLLAGAFFYAFFVPYVSNGEADLAKHMYLFIELIDLALIGILAMSLYLPKRAGAILAMMLSLVIIVSLVPYRQYETVSFGGYCWYVIDENDSCKTLLSKDVVANRSYHTEANNQYKLSDIHRWLNEEFIAGFSDDERAMLFPKEENVLLSSAHMTEHEGGYRDFYCSAFPKRVDTNSSQAYYQTVSGYAFLPTVQQISDLANHDFDVTVSEKYWLSTPYFNNGEKSRYVHPDGLVYFENTEETLGIRPVIYLKK